MNTEKIKVVLTKGSDDFGAYLDDIPGIYGAGDSAAEAKKSLEKSLKLYIQNNSDIPKALKGKFILIYQLDCISILNYYKGIFTHSALEKLTGINQRQLQHYASGLKSPRKPQLRKIEKALHQLGNELLSIEL